MDKLKTAVIESAPKALWIGGSAALWYLITTLLKRPDLAPYYGALNLLLIGINEARKAE